MLIQKQTIPTAFGEIKTGREEGEGNFLGAEQLFYFCLLDTPAVGGRFLFFLSIKIKRRTDHLHVN